MQTRNRDLDCKNRDLMCTKNRDLDCIQLQTCIRHNMSINCPRIKTATLRIGHILLGFSGTFWICCCWICIGNTRAYAVCVAVCVASACCSVSWYKLFHLTLRNIYHPNYSPSSKVLTNRDHESTELARPASAFAHFRYIYIHIGLISHLSLL